MIRLSVRPCDNKSPIVITLRRKYLHCIQERKIFDTKSLEDVTCPLSQPRTCRLRSLSHDVMSQKCIQRPKVDLTKSKKKGVKEWLVRTFVMLYQKSSPAGLVLKFKIWRLISFIGEDLDYFLFLLVRRTGIVGWTKR